MLVTEKKLNATKTPFTYGPHVLICNREALIAVTHIYIAQLACGQKPSVKLSHVAHAIMCITHSLLAKSHSRIHEVRMAKLTEV